MAMTLTILYQLFIMLALAVVGWVLTKTGKMSDDKALAGLLANAVLPALILYSLQVPYSAALLREIAVTAAGYFVIFLSAIAVGIALGKAARQPSKVIGSWTSCIFAPNVMFMGWPIMHVIFGDDAFPLTAGIVLAFNISSFVFMPLLFSMGGEGGVRISPRDVFLQPAIMAVILGIMLFLMPFRLPGPVSGFLSVTASLATPVSMIMIGSSLAKCSLRETFLDSKVYLVTATRLTLAPLAGHLLIRPFIADPMILGMLTIAAFMPVAAIVPAIAAQRSGDMLFCSKAVVISTVLSVFTVPFLLPLLIR
ncbi:MAG: AEC family transporter [Oscillospiraceae bacterium]|nr:AEC family transporter [Oscillospiraceae bacterium]